MKLRNKLIATIVSISMILAVIGVGAWASTESFTATITNTVNLEFDNLKGTIIVMAGGGADNLQTYPPVIEEQVLYDGTNVVYNQISANPTSGTNLYWAGTTFMDSSDDGLGIVNNETEAAVLTYGFVYTPTEECVGTSNIAVMVNEINAPEIEGCELIVEYFVTGNPNGTIWALIQPGVPVILTSDDQMIAVLAVCQYYNTAGESITTTADAWDFQVVFTSTREDDNLDSIGDVYQIDAMDFADGVLLPSGFETATEPEDPWEYIEFGEYPQTLKADNVTITSTTPDANGYYSGSDGERYAKRVANQNATTESGIKLQRGTEYYFKVEPIKWKVLESVDGKTFVIADKVIESLIYQGDYDQGSGWILLEVEDDSYTSMQDGMYEEYDTMDPDHPDFEIPMKTIEIEPNNYEYSWVREFAVGSFYNKSFSASEKNLILTSAPTYDKVFVPSVEEFENPNYNLVGASFEITDYAMAMGFDWRNEGLCWSRTPMEEDRTSVYFIASQGVNDGSFDVAGLSGFMPGMYISR